MWCWDGVLINSVYVIFIFWNFEKNIVKMKYRRNGGLNKYDVRGQVGDFDFGQRVGKGRMGL